MKVTNQGNAGIQSLSSKKTGTKGLENSLSGTGKTPSIVSEEMLSSSAKVDVSPRAKEINRVRELARQGSDVDEAKIAKFQGLIDRGAYKVDSEAVADRIVNESVLNALAEGNDE